MKVRIFCPLILYILSVPVSFDFSCVSKVINEDCLEGLGKALIYELWVLIVFSSMVCISPLLTIAAEKPCPAEIAK